MNIHWNSNFRVWKQSLFGTQLHPAFQTVCVCLGATRAERNPFHRDPMVCRADNIYHLALDRKRLPTLRLLCKDQLTPKVKIQKRKQKPTMEKKMPCSWADFFYARLEPVLQVHPRQRRLKRATLPTKTLPFFPSCNLWKAQVWFEIPWKSWKWFLF